MDKEVKSETFINGNGKVHFSNRTIYSTKMINYEFNRFFYTDIIKLLLNVFEERLIIPELKVMQLYTLTFSGFQNIRSAIGENGYLNPVADNIVCEFEYNNVFYLADFHVEVDRVKQTHYTMNFSYPDTQTADERIGHKLLRIAFEHTSDFKNGCCEISLPFGEREAISYLDVNFVKPHKSSLENIFIREDIKSDIKRFIYAFKNYDKHKIPLRYLLSGKPGLGKTEVIRSIIAECSDFGCVIIPNEMSGADWLVFEFAKLFKPALVCIDDIDLIFGRRESINGKKSLNHFLTMLDGILQNKFFLIATTNDKKLVDIAASRPGRFDEVIDFGELEKKYYKNLIRERTNNNHIVELFEDDIMDYMESKKVNGAYIVNLVKQIIIMKEMNPAFSKDDLLKYINRNHKGFYTSQTEKEKQFGFRK